MHVLRISNIEKTQHATSFAITHLALHPRASAFGLTPLAASAMRKAPAKQTPRTTEVKKQIPDFCPGTAWPKSAPGPPPIANPAKHSSRVPTYLVRSLSPALLDGPTKGVPESKLLIKYAADKQQGELSLLLKNGQNPNVKHKVDWQDFETTPLFEGSVNGYKRIVRLLIEHGAMVNAQVGPGLTPLYNAALIGQDEVVRLLIENGADPSISTDSGVSPLYVAAQGGHGDCLVDILSSRLMTQTVVDYSGNGNGATALYIAAQNGHFKCVRELVQAGAALDPKMTSCGSTPLHAAMFLAQELNDRPHRDIVEMLLNAGASINDKNHAGLSVRDLAMDDNSLIKLVDDERDRRASGGSWWS